LCIFKNIAPIEVEETEEKGIEEKHIPLEGESQICQVCQEVLVKFYDQEREEWMLKNAIKKDDKFYHRICIVNRSLTPTSSLGKRKKEPEVKDEPKSKVTKQEPDAKVKKESPES
jgi:hypothetical protein